MAEHPEIQKALDDCDAGTYTPEDARLIRREVGEEPRCGGAGRIVHPPYKGAPETIFSCPGCPDCEGGEG